MKNKNTRNRLYMIIGSVAIFILVGLIGFNLYQKITDTIYIERKESLSQLIETSADVFNKTVESEWDLADLYTNNAISYLKDYESVDEYLSILNNLLVHEGDYYFLVDTSGKYYCSDGHFGKLIDTEYYLSQTSDKLEYLGNLSHLNIDDTYLIFRSRLKQTILTRHNDEQVEIIFCALMHSANQLDQSISDVFGGKNNMIIYDTDTGVMMHKKFGIKLIIDGYNVYPKFYADTLTYKDDPNEIIEKIKDEETIVTQMQAPQEDYYICSTKLNVSNWSLLMVVQASYFNNLISNSYKNIITYISIIIVLLGAAIVGVLIWYTINRTNENRLMEEEKVSSALKQAYKIKSDFLSNMSHDIRTPINGIIGMATIGAKIEGNSDKTNDCFKKINVSSKHLLSLVNDVLDMSEIESNKTTFTPAKFNLKLMLEECLDITKGQLIERKIDLKEDIDVKQKYIIGDELHLKRVLINILNNAVKFTKDGGSICLMVRQLELSDKKVSYEFKVSDTGIGMSKEFLTKLFEPFVQEKAEARSKYVGSGLGTAIAKDYVEMMQGSIAVDSELNKGTTFTICLPFELVKEENENIITDKLNILLVDDNDLNIEITRELLKEKANSITVAHNGQQALDLFKASKLKEFDLILMDVMMPIMDGLEASKCIRALDRADHNIPIIALTANSYKKDIEKVFQAGMNACLSKPFNVEKLYQAISEVNANEINN